MNNTILKAAIENDLGEVMRLAIEGILVDNCRFLNWCNHPEYITSDGGTLERKEGGGYVVEGTVFYRGEEEKVRVDLDENMCLEGERL